MAAAVTAAPSASASIVAAAALLALRVRESPGTRPALGAGTLLALLPWDNEADLIAQCNDNPYGLACGIWTRDYRSAWRLGAALQTGTVWVNTYKQFSSSTPFGGFKS